MKNIKNKFIPLLISIFAAVTLGLSGCMDLFDDSEVSTDRDVKYNVTYKDGVDGSITVPVDDKNYESGSPVTIDSMVPVRSGGYTFIGWKKSDESSDKLYQPSEVFIIDASVTLTANWKENTIGGGITLDATEEKDKSLYLVAVADGTNITIKCAADYTYTWYIDGTLTNVGTGVEIEEGGIKKMKFTYPIPSTLKKGYVDITLLAYAAGKTYSETFYVLLK